MTDELENKLIKYMTDFLTELLYDEIDTEVLRKYDELDEVLDMKWDENNPELAKWFKELRNVDIKKFDHYATYRNDFQLEKTVDYYVIDEVEHLFGISENGANSTYFNPKNYFEDEEELKEIDKYIRKYTKDTESDWLEWFSALLFDSVVAAIKTLWFFANMMNMDEDEIKKFQF